jgi:hypothetical protein
MRKDEVATADLQNKFKTTVTGEDLIATKLINFKQVATFVACSVTLAKYIMPGQVLMNKGWPSLKNMADTEVYCKTKRDYGYYKRSRREHHRSSTAYKYYRQVIVLDTTQCSRIGTISKVQVKVCKYQWKSGPPGWKQQVRGCCCGRSSNT